MLTAKNIGLTVILVSNCCFSSCSWEFRDQGMEAAARETQLNLVSAKKSRYYSSLLPKRVPQKLATTLHSTDIIYYNQDVMEPAFQDSAGSHVGVVANAIDPEKFDGQRQLFCKQGQFHFPFGYCNRDKTPRQSKFNFWLPPRDSDGSLLPVVYWRENSSRWRWKFPIGTVFGEVHLVAQPGTTPHVFEIRTRRKTTNGWSANVYRPFASAAELANRIMELRPNYRFNPDLAALMDHLNAKATLTAKGVRSQSFLGSSFKAVEGYEDKLPEFVDSKLVKDLLVNSAFRSVKGKEWKRQGSKVTYGPANHKQLGLSAPHSVDSLIGTSDASCRQCHQDAGQPLARFHQGFADLGELWGEDEIFSWHLFEPQNFAGDVAASANNSNDNRAVRQRFIELGLVKEAEPSTILMTDL